MPLLFGRRRHCNYKRRPMPISAALIPTRWSLNVLTFLELNQIRPLTCFEMVFPVPNIDGNKVLNFVLVELVHALGNVLKVDYFTVSVFSCGVSSWANMTMAFQLDLVTMNVLALRICYLSLTKQLSGTKHLYNCAYSFHVLYVLSRRINRWYEAKIPLYTFLLSTHLVTFLIIQGLLDCLPMKNIVLCLFSEAKRRKWLENNPESSSNDNPIIFDTSIIPWWAWVKRYHLPEAELLNGLSEIPLL